MSEIMKTFAANYNEIIWSLVLFLRGLGMTFLTVNMVNGVLALIILFIIMKLYSLARQAAIYTIILIVILVPMLFLIISSYFYGGASIHDISNPKNTISY